MMVRPQACEHAIVTLITLRSKGYKLWSCERGLDMPAHLHVINPPTEPFFPPWAFAGFSYELRLLLRSEKFRT